MKKTGIELIAIERQEQIEKHGRTIERDVEMNDALQLPNGAKTLISNPYLHALPWRKIQELKPVDWDMGIWSNMCNKPYKERLVIAGALIAAEIDRIQSEEGEP